MVKLRLRGIWYIAKRHIFHKYLINSCGYAKGLDLPFSVWLNHKIISNLPRLHMQNGSLYFPTKFKIDGHSIYTCLWACFGSSLLPLFYFKFYFWSFSNWKITQVSVGFTSLLIGCLCAFSGIAILRPRQDTRETIGKVSQQCKVTWKCLLVAGTQRRNAAVRVMAKATLPVTQHLSHLQWADHVSILLEITSLTLTKSQISYFHILSALTVLSTLIISLQAPSSRGC